MASEQIRVGYNSTPTVQRELLDEQGNPVNLTGYTIKLIVKQSLELPDSRAWFDKAGGLVTATSGLYKYDLTTAETTLPEGTWPGEERFWSGATTSPPKYRRRVDFIQEEAVDLA